MIYASVERVCLAAAVTAFLALAPSPARAQAKPAPAGAPRAAAPLEVIQLRDNFYAIVGAGANIALQIGPDGVVVVDTGSGQRSADVIAEIKKLTTRPV